jgi:adiponectin receptor
MIFAGYLGSCCILCSFSAIYHLFSAWSESVHNVVVKLDFSGIVFVICSSTMMAFWYGFHCDPFLRNTYMLVTALIDIALLISVFSHMDVSIRRTVFVSAILIGVFPFGHLIYRFGMTSVAFHVIVLCLLYSIAFAFYITKFPEKYYNRTFDIFGASHQIWHLVLDVAFVYFYLAMESVHYSLSYANCE